MKYLICVFALLPTALPAQVMYVHLSDGSSSSYPITEVRSTDVEDAAMRVFLYDGTEYTFAIADVVRCDFVELTTGHDEHGATATFSELSAYPNPTSGDVTISFNVEVAGGVTVEIFDTEGKLIRTVQQSWCSPGLHTIKWNGSDNDGQKAANGTYLCRTQWGTHSCTKKIVIGL